MSAKKKKEQILAGYSLLRILYSSRSWVILTFSIIAEAHSGLAEADCVFPLSDAIELFEFSLVDALNRKGD